jgi:hypothetical protein
MARDLVRSRQMLREEHYEVLSAGEIGELVAVQVKRTGIVAIDLGR